MTVVTVYIFTQYDKLEVRNETLMEYIQKGLLKVAFLLFSSDLQTTLEGKPPSL